MVKALYVEKKPEFANRAKELIKEFRESLQIANLTNIRVINRYLIEDLSDKAFERLAERFFQNRQLILATRIWTFVNRL